MAPALKMISVVTEADTGLGFAFSAGLVCKLDDTILKDSDLKPALCLYAVLNQFRLNK